MFQQHGQCQCLGFDPGANLRGLRLGHDGFDVQFVEQLIGLLKLAQIDQGRKQVHFSSDGQLVPPFEEQHVGAFGRNAPYGSRVGQESPHVGIGLSTPQHLRAKPCQQLFFHRFRDDVSQRVGLGQDQRRSASAVDVIISTTMPVGERTRAVLHSLHSTDSGLHQSIHADLFVSSFGRGQLWQQKRRAQNRRSLFDAAIGVFQHPLER